MSGGTRRQPRRVSRVSRRGGRLTRKLSPNPPKHTRILGADASDPCVGSCARSVSVDPGLARNPQAEVERLHRLGELADRDVVDAGQRVGAGVVQADLAGDLNLGPALDEGDGLANLPGGKLSSITMLTRASRACSSSFMLVTVSSMRLPGWAFLRVRTMLATPSLSARCASVPTRRSASVR